MKKNELKERAEKLAHDIPALFIAMKYKETPFLAKFIGSLTIIYALSPIDLIPDFIPFIGYLDDLIILPSLIVLTVKLIPDEIFQRARKESRDIWNDGKPEKWYYAIPFVLFWLILIALIVKAFIK